MHISCLLQIQLPHAHSLRSLTPTPTGIPISAIDWSWTRSWSWSVIAMNPQVLSGKVLGDPHLGEHIFGNVFQVVVDRNSRVALGHLFEIVFECGHHRV